jgi:hypothetical protein
MSKRHFSILLLISLAVALAVFLIPSRTSRDASAEPSVYMPELAAMVNDIERIRITTNGGSEVVTLERGEGGWSVREFTAYGADWSVLKPLLADLSQAEVQEVKTSNPEYYDRLGVEDPLSEGSESTLIEFPDDESIPAVIVGNQAQGREGRYLRRQSESRSVLVDRTITIPLDSKGWLEREIVDIPDAEVVTVRISHGDGETIEISRVDTTVNDFALDAIPEGRKTKSAYAVNQLASSLSSLALDGVAPVDDVSWEGAIGLTVITESGLQVDARLVEDEEHRWLRLEASGDEAADAINQRVTAWAYQIPLYKFDAINKRMEDLLAEVEEDSDAEQP